MSDELTYVDRLPAPRLRMVAVRRPHRQPARRQQHPHLLPRLPRPSRGPPRTHARLGAIRGESMTRPMPTFAAHTAMLVLCESCRYVELGEASA